MSLDLAPTHRQRKKDATRRAIYEAAFALVEEHGLSRVTVEEISRQAGVAPRTFWSYFSSKEDAVLNRDPDRPDSIRRAVLARPAGEDPFTSVRRVLIDDLASRMPDAEQAWRRAQLVRREPALMAAAAANFDEVERALAAGIALRLGRDADIDLLPGVLASAACGTCRVALERWSGEKGGAALDDLIDQAFGELAGGLTSLSGGLASLCDGPRDS